MQLNEGSPPSDLCDLNRFWRPLVLMSQTLLVYYLAF